MKKKSSKRPASAASRRRKSATARKLTVTRASTGKRIRSLSTATIQPVSAAGLLDGGAPDDQFLDANVPGLGRNAANPNERRKALLHVVNNVWIVEDITALRRVESGGAFKWVMWRRSSLPPA